MSRTVLRGVENRAKNEKSEATTGGTRLNRNHSPTIQTLLSSRTNNHQAVDQIRANSSQLACHQSKACGLVVGRTCPAGKLITRGASAVGLSTRPMLRFAELRTIDRAVASQAQATSHQSPNLLDQRPSKGRRADENQAVDPLQRCIRRVIGGMDLHRSHRSTFEF